MKYRKKPVVIEAIQWTGLNQEEIKAFVGKDLQYDIMDAAWEVEKGVPHVNMKIHTLEGDHECTKDDFIVKGVNGEFYPCKPDIFDKTYEVVGNEPNIRITSDGVTAKIHIHGEQVRCRAIDFHGDAENGIHISWDYEAIREDENGKILIEDDVVATETVHFDNMERD